MYRPAPLPAAAQRRGAILIVVLAMLALFAVIGLGFVFYADSEANVARMYKDAQSQSDVAPPDGGAAFKNYLSSLIYDVGDTSSTDLTNAARGHGLARSMYGWSGQAGRTRSPSTGWASSTMSRRLPRPPHIRRA